MKLSYRTSSADIDRRVIDFVTSCGLDDSFCIVPIPQDASKKKYYRVERSDGLSYIVMDVYNDPEVAGPFIKIANYLQTIDLRSPQIERYDPNLHLVLLEDFGNDSFSKILEYDPDQERRLYQDAVMVLSHLSSMRHDIQLSTYDFDALNDELKNFTLHYLPNFLDKDTLSLAVQEFFLIFSKMFCKLDKANNVLVLRDYHVDNLIFLGAGDGRQRVGIIDFQDALLGSSAYDLVSLLEDVRRDIEPEVVKFSKDLFLKSANILDKEAFEYDYLVLGMQRNLKIIGIFTKLCSMGRLQYARYLPRVFKYVTNNLRHPVMHDLDEWFDKYNIRLHV